MGGRRTVTYVVDSRSGAVTANSAFADNQRCLGDQLGGVIFGCTTETYQECIVDRVFGLPKAHMLYVKEIQPGLPLFLFNYSGRRLHGVFRASSEGGLNIKPHGWTKGAKTPTQFPAQVRVEVFKKCEPIQENVFKSILQSNYKHDDRHFVFELDKKQVKALCSLFKCEVPKSPYPNAEILESVSRPAIASKRNQSPPQKTSGTQTGGNWPAKKIPAPSPLPPAAAPALGPSPIQNKPPGSSGAQPVQGKAPDNKKPKVHRLNMDDFPALTGSPHTSSMKQSTPPKKPLGGNSTGAARMGVSRDEGLSRVKDSNGMTHSEVVRIQASERASPASNQLSNSPQEECTETQGNRIAAIKSAKPMEPKAESVVKKRLKPSKTKDKQPRVPGVNASPEGNEKDRKFIAEGTSKARFADQSEGNDGWKLVDAKRKSSKAPPPSMLRSMVASKSKSPMSSAKCGGQLKPELSESSRKTVLGQGGVLSSHILEPSVPLCSSASEPLKPRAEWVGKERIFGESKGNSLLLEDVSEWTRGRQVLKEIDGGKKGYLTPPESPDLYRSSGEVFGSNMDGVIGVGHQFKQNRLKDSTHAPADPNSDDLMEMDPPDVPRRARGGDNGNGNGNGPETKGTIHAMEGKLPVHPKKLAVPLIINSPMSACLNDMQGREKAPVKELPYVPFMKDGLRELRTEIEVFPVEFQSSGSSSSCSSPVVLFSHRREQEDRTSSSELMQDMSLTSTSTQELPLTVIYPSQASSHMNWNPPDNRHLGQPTQVQLVPDVNYLPTLNYSVPSMLTPSSNHPSCIVPTPQAPFSASMECLLIVGGLDASFVSTIELYNPATNTWVAISQLPFEKFLCGDATSIGPWLYVIRGEVEGKVPSSPSFCLNTVTGMWHTVAPTVIPRANLGMATVNGKIVALGGRNEDHSLASIEYYDPNTDRWYAGAEMSTPRYDAGVCARDGVIYACGGFDGRNFLKTVDFLDPRMGYWQRLPDMTSPRGGLACQLCYGNLWLVGGDDGKDALSTVEAYDPRAQRWTQAPNLGSGRAYCTVEIMNEQLYAIGGRRSKLAMGCLGMERFDPVKCAWEEGLSAGASGSRCFHSSSVVS